MPRKDYWSPALEKAIDRAVALLVEHRGEWSSVLDAYWLLRRHEKEIGFPFTYPMVEEIVAQARRLIERGVHAAEATT